MDNLEGGHLLGDEQHATAPVHGAGDDVGDGLRLAGPGRALNDQVLAGHDLLDGDGLGAVGVGDVDQLGEGKDLVDPPVVSDQRRVLHLLIVAQQDLAQDRMSGELAWPWPVGWVQVPPEQELGEGEEAQQDFIAADAPAGPFADGRGDLGGVVGGRPVLVLRQVGQGEAEIVLQPGLQTHIGDQIVGTKLQFEAVLGPVADEIHRQQDERRVAGRVGGAGLPPLQEAQGQEQHIDPLFLLQGLAFIIEAQQALLEGVGGHGGGQATLTRGAFADVDRRLCGRRLSASGEGHDSSGAERPEDVVGPASGNPHLTGGGRAQGGVDQPVAQGPVQQAIARAFQGRGEGLVGVLPAWRWWRPKVIVGPGRGHLIPHRAPPQASLRLQLWRAAVRPGNRPGLKPGDLELGVRRPD